jgi:hypothetical protein
MRRGRTLGGISPRFGHREDNYVNELIKKATKDLPKKYKNNNYVDSPRVLSIELTFRLPNCE